MVNENAIAGVGGLATGVGGMWLAGQRFGEGEVVGGVGLATIGMVGGTLLGAGGLVLWLSGTQTPLAAAALGLGAGTFVGPFAAAAGVM